MEHKYTEDGKKVKVVGELTNKDYIVQEIAIVDGEEVALVSNFIVKDLYDKPIITWKANHFVELEAIYERKRKDCEKKIKEIFDIEQDLYDKVNVLKQRLNYVEKVLNKADENTLDTLMNFLSGGIKWIVVPDTCPSISEWSSNEMLHSKIRLISLFGDNNGTLQYGMNLYSTSFQMKDNVYFIPFTNYEEAFDKFKELVLEAKISKELMICSKKYDIQLDTDKVAKWKEEQLNIYLENIKLCNEKIMANDKAIDKLSNL